VEAAGAADAQNAPTTPWKPQNGFHSYHKALFSFTLFCFGSERGHFYRVKDGDISNES